MEEEPSSQIIRPPELSPPRCVFRAVGRSDLGTRHKINEDRWAASTTSTGGAVLIVCDGMGGMGSGDRAAETARDILLDRITADRGDPIDVARGAVSAADLKVLGSFEPKNGKMPGTTCTVVTVQDGVAYASWVGDSSIFLIRAGRIITKSRPHRLVQDLIDAGSMTEEEAKVSPMRRYLSRSLGGRTEEGEPVQPDHLKPMPLMHGDRIVLCSDGLTDFVTETEIAEITSRTTARAAADRLVNLAVERGVDDNVTCVVGAVDDAADPVDTDDILGDAWETSAKAASYDPDYDSDIRVASELDVTLEPQRLPSRPVSPLLVALAVVLVGGLLILGLLVGFLTF